MTPMIWFFLGYFSGLVTIPLIMSTFNVISRVLDDARDDYLEVGSKERKEMWARKDRDHPDG